MEKQRFKFKVTFSNSNSDHVRVMSYLSATDPLDGMSQLISQYGKEKYFRILMFKELISQDY